MEKWKGQTFLLHYIFRDDFLSNYSIIIIYYTERKSVTAFIQASSK